MNRAFVFVALAACGSNTPAPLPDAPASPWSSGPEIPVPRLEAGVTAIGQSVAVVGGFDTDQVNGLDVTTRVDLFDTFGGTWSQLPDAPVARHHVQIAAIGTTLYLLGGLDGAPDVSNDYPARGDCYKLDLGDMATGWVPLASMPAGYERGSAAVIVAPPRIFLLGGASTTDAVASNISYDVIADQWITGELPDLPQPRSHPAAVRRVDGTFVLAGGLAHLASDTAQADVYLLPPDRSAWKPGTPMPETRGGCAYGLIGGQLICAGGETGMSALKTTQGYDVLNDTWTDYPNMPLSTAGTLGAAVGQRLYVPGGARALVFEPQSTMFVFSPLDTAN